MLTLILTLLIISVLIIVHEGGHYLFAKLTGVVVEEFSIGFGPPLYQKKRNGELISIRTIPFGGFVRLKGQEFKEHYEKDDFNAKPYISKLLVVLAGPLFNLFLAILLYFILYTVVGYPDTSISKIGRVYKGQLAWKAGIRPGDSLLSVNNKPMKNWSDFWRALKVNDTNTIILLRDKDTLTVKFYLSERDTLGIEPYIPPVVEAIEKDGPAYKAGIRRYDTILQVDTVKVSMFQDVGEYVRKRPGDTVLFVVKRGEDTLVFKVVPLAVSIEKGDTFGKIGIAAYTKTVRMGFWEGIKSAFVKTYEVNVLTLKFIYNLFTGKTSFKNLGGIITVGRLVHSSESMGSRLLIKIASLINLSAALSINLFLLNLIPFPALDGFHVFVFTIEAIIKKPLKKEVLESIQFAGFVALVVLMVLITAMDILKIWHR